MVKTYYQGRMGNLMFIYAVGRTIAENKNYKLFSEPIKGFDRTNDLVDGEVILHNPYVTGNYSDQKLDLKTIYNHNGAIHINGYYQQYEYIQPNKDNIKEWFKFGEDTWDKPNKNDLVVHIRLDDYLTIDTPNGKGGNYLGYDFYHDTIKSESFENCYILTDSPNHEDILKLKSEGCKIFHKSPLEDMYFISKANKIIMSHSTFSWWGTFLSNAEVIHFPLMKNEKSRGLWATFGSIDLRITDSNKINYIYI